MKGNTVFFSSSPAVASSAAVGGIMEGKGPMSDCFDEINEDPFFSCDTFEQGESKLLKQTVLRALDKGSLTSRQIDVMFGGDLLNQCVGTTYGIRDLDIPFLGIYGACSTVTEGLLLSSLFVDGGYASRALAVTSSHFCAAERQYRFPLNYGGQRTPTSQYTATAAGALVVSAERLPPYVRAATVGKVVDMGVTDAANMGAAMAPAAYSSIRRFLDDTGLRPEFFDAIVTGDLGKVGSRLLCELFDRDGIDIRSLHRDCGTMLYSFDKQDVHAGASGAGCAASMLCGFFVPKLRSGEFRNILFAATGALLSPTVNAQGESIPSISHAVWLSYENGSVPDIRFKRGRVN
ncbi:stage V sporulation protein AD [Ruminococcaceae bacterium FB2012]|nr:stage V sporulation protein AD [Ruminococcaceae bacterium FB2012]